MRINQEARKSRKLVKHAAVVMGLALSHFALALGFGLIGYGLDFDQLRSRTAVSVAASAIHDALMLPHRTFLRSLPGGAITGPMVIPAALYGHSIAWGIALFVVSRAFRRRDRESLSEERS
jgi:uncharacterized oligopeptide transporter (OPT) family protein